MCQKKKNMLLMAVADLGFFKHYSQTFRAIFPVKYIAAVVFEKD